MIAPDGVDLAGRHRKPGLALHPLDHPDQPADIVLVFRPVLVGLGLRLADPLRLFAQQVFRVLLVQPQVRQRKLLVAIDGLVADDDAVDVAVLAGERKRRLDFAVVALGILVEPDAERNPKPEFLGDFRNGLGAAGGRIGADRPGVGRDRLQVGANLFGRAAPVLVPVGGAAVERIVGDAGELIAHAWRADHVPGKSPNTGMKTCNGNDANKRGEAHQSNQVGLENLGPNPSPGSALAAEQHTSSEAM